MKIYKKIALNLIILILATTLNVYAADYADTPTTGEIAEVTLTQSSTTAKVGETVTITISAKYEKGIEGVDAILEYDRTKLKLTNLETKNYYSSHSGIDDKTGKFIFSLMYGEVGAPEETPIDVDLATVSFTVLDAAEKDENLTIKLSGIEIIDPNVDVIKEENKEVKLTIVGEQQPEGGEQEPGDEEQQPEGGEQEPEGGEQQPESGEQEPGGEEQKPEGGEQQPGDEEQKPEGEEKDPTIAGKPMNNAGLVTYGTISMIIVIASGILYTKYKKYRDVK